MEVNADMNSTSTEPSCELAASSSQNSLPGDSFMEVNADMNSTSSEPTCELAASSYNSMLVLRTHCHAAAHYFVDMKKMFLVQDNAISQNSLPCCSSLLCGHEEDVPGASQC